VPGKMKKKKSFKIPKE